MEIIPAILEDDIVGIQAKLDKLADFSPETHHVQLDITDGTLTPQSSWHEPSELSALRWASEIELHLMQINPPLKQWLVDSRVTRCVIHAESSDPRQSLLEIKTLGRRAGLALNPATTVAQVSEFLAVADYVLLLTVTPGAQGQPFQASVLTKVQQLHRIKPDLPVYVDGGVSDVTIQPIREASCAGVAVGSFLWRAEDLAKALRELRAM